MDDLSISSLKGERDGSEMIRYHSVVRRATLPGDDSRMKTDELLKFFTKSTVRLGDCGDEVASIS